MAEYLARWEINVEGSSPKQAAKAARQYARKGSWSSVFDMTDEAGTVTRVDLDEGTQETIPQTPAPDMAELLRDASATISSLLHQVGQMSGMFSDDDGTIAEAVQDAEAVQERIDAARGEG